MDPILKTLADNPALMAALENEIRAEFVMPEDTTQFTNEQLGEIVRGHAVGRSAVTNALKRIARLKTPPQKPFGPHPGR